MGASPSNGIDSLEGMTLAAVLFAIGGLGLAVLAILLH